MPSLTLHDEVESYEDDQRYEDDWDNHGGSDGTSRCKRKRTSDLEYCIIHVQINDGFVPVCD